MAQRVKLAGFEAIVGPFVLGSFWVLGALGFLGGVILVVTGEVAISGTLVGGLALLLAALAFFAWTIWSGLRQFRVVAIDDDGTWRLINPLGMTIGRVAAGAPRTVDVQRRERWMFIGTAVKYTQSQVVIASGGRTWRSSRSIPKYQHPAIQVLTRPR